MASRQQVATHLAAHLGDGRREAVRAAAAWLVSTGKARQANYLAGDVATVLAAQGHVYVRITSARPLTAPAKTMIEDFVRARTGAKEIELELAINPDLVGGVVVETPDAVMDASVRTKLARYVEGVTK